MSVLGWQKPVFRLAGRGNQPGDDLQADLGDGETEAAGGGGGSRVSARLGRDGGQPDCLTGRLAGVPCVGTDVSPQTVSERLDSLPRQLDG
ncbi:unnamed protein product [Protopolystoma xenopodis]|uniref:Uncharacterized protein n=1 Tax=Protopolystoma xenopodis TaxID=117903 RepID=A0A448XPK1_9PLAT|nr:unnamed protein product [Protopolystoma xenopodis]